MMRSKFARAFVFGVCLTVFSSTAAFAAETGAAKPADGIMTIMEGVEGSGVSGEVRPVAPVGEKMLKEQDRINQYVFEQHKDEISRMGITVTHTAPLEKQVEIGIIPYNDKNAEYFYNAFGKNRIKVVEGIQATTMELPVPGEADGNVVKTNVEGPDVMVQSAPLSDDGGDGVLSPEQERDQIYTLYGQEGAPEVAVTSAADTAGDAGRSAAASSSTATAAIIAVSAVLLAGAVFLGRRLKTTKA